MIKKCVGLVHLLLMCGMSQASMIEENVLVVGAGPAGLSMVKALQNSGCKNIDIIEQKSEMRFDGAGFAVPANADWVLQQMGIDISSKAIPVSKMRFTDHQGTLLTEENIAQIHPEGAQFYALTRRDLMHVLLDSMGEVPIQTGVTLLSFTEEANKISVEFSDGKSKIYDWVIACDGVHSAVRKKACPEEKSEFLDLFVWRTLGEAPEGLEVPIYMMGSGRLALIYPMPHNKAYIYGHLAATPTEALPLTADPINSFSDTFASFGGLMPAVIEAIRTTRPYFYTHNMEKSHSVRFTAPPYKRLLFAGDAAHAFGPMLQNGAAQAFEDAYVIQELLRQPHGDIPGLIQAFEMRRQGRTQRVFDMSNQRIKVISDPAQVEALKAHIRTHGAPNVNGFKAIMKENP